MAANKKAQSTIEYTTMAILVMVAIFFIGPYVIRAVNSHFKGMNDQAEDAFDEAFTQEPPTGVPLPVCNCSLLEFCRCGTGAPGDCDLLEEMWCVTCDPPGCGNELEECRPNPQVNWPITDKCCWDWACTGNVTDCDDCPPNEGEQVRFCGEEVLRETQCAPCPECTFSCTGGVDNCANEFVCGDNPPLIMDTPWTHVDEGACTDPIECEAACRAGLIGSGGTCDCPGSLIKNAVCGCDCPPPFIGPPHQQCQCSGTWTPQGFFCDYEPNTITNYGYCTGTNSVVTEPLTNPCIWTLGGGSGNSHLTFYSGPAPDGNGWMCYGQVDPGGGNWCNPVAYNTRPSCVPFEESCTMQSPHALRRPVYQQPTLCGEDLSPRPQCVSERGCPGGDAFGCTGVCQSFAYLCPTSGVYGYIPYGIPGNPPLYLQPGACGKEFYFPTGGANYWQSSTELTSKPTCQTEWCASIVVGGGDWKDCNGECKGNAPATCPTFQIGYLLTSADVSEPKVPVYQEPALCGDNLSYNSQCRTALCDYNVFFDCAGNCTLNVPGVCNNTLVGYLPTGNVQPLPYPPAFVSN